MDSQGYILTEAPIFTPAACEGTTTLFEVQYIDDEKAYLTQSGQLYVEATAMALGKVYTLRADLSRGKIEDAPPPHRILDARTGSRLRAPGRHDGAGRRPGQPRRAIGAQEPRARTRNDWARRLQTREASSRPFRASPTTKQSKFCRSTAIPRNGATISAATKKRFSPAQYDRPVMVHRYPAAMKAFYMQPDPERPELALGFDMLAPEGYGEIIGGGERVADYDLLLKRLREQQSARRGVSVVSGPAPLRQRAARGLRPGPGTHGGLDLRN